MLLLCRGPEDGLGMEEAVPWMKKDVLASIEQLVSQDEIVPAGALRVRLTGCFVLELEYPC